MQPSPKRIALAGMVALTFVVSGILGWIHFEGRDAGSGTPDPASAPGPTRSLLGDRTTSSASSLEQPRAEGGTLPSENGRPAAVAAASWSNSSERVLSLLNSGDFTAEALTQRYEEAAARVSPAERRRLVAEIGRQLAAGESGVATEFLAQLSDRNDARIFAGMVASALFETDPHAAVQWAEQSAGDEPLAEHLHGMIGRLWGRSDLESGLAWADAMNAGSLREAALEGVVFSWVQHDTEGAYEWVVAHEPKEVQDRLLAKMAKVIAATKPQEAAEWAAQLPASNHATGALRYAVQRWASRETATAVAWAEGQTNAESRAAALQGAAAAWTAIDPEASVGWIADWPMDDDGGGLKATQERALMAATLAWSKQSPADAVDWIEGNDRGAVLVEGLLRQMAMSDREAATEFAGQINDPDLKKIADRVLGAMTATE